MVDSLRCYSDVRAGLPAEALAKAGGAEGEPPRDIKNPTNPTLSPM
jgi:hypothetical protein